MVLTNTTPQLAHGSDIGTTSAEIVGVVSALHDERLGRRKGIAEAVRGDKIDRDQMVKNICDWNSGFVPLQEAIEKTGLPLKEAVEAAIDYCLRLHQAQTPFSVS